MKLLTKQQVNTEVAHQKKLQIDEGVAIAKKVDALRNTLAGLEKQHSLFLQGMEKELKLKTERLTEEIYSREKEILTLQAKKAELERPLTQKWYEVNKQDEYLKLKIIEIEQEKADFDKKKERLEEKLKKESDTLSLIKIRERELVKVLDKAEENAKDTERIKQETIVLKEKQDKYAEIKEQQLNARELSITSYEFTLKMKAEQLEIKEKEIADEKIRLLDMRATLERALNRTR